MLWWCRDHVHLSHSSWKFDLCCEELSVVGREVFQMHLCGSGGLLKPASFQRQRLSAVSEVAPLARHSH